MVPQCWRAQGNVGPGSSPLRGTVAFPGLQSIVPAGMRAPHPPGAGAVRPLPPLYLALRPYTALWKVPTACISGTDSLFQNSGMLLCQQACAGKLIFPKSSFSQSLTRIGVGILQAPSSSPSGRIILRHRLYAVSQRASAPVATRGSWLTGAPFTGCLPPLLPYWLSAGPKETLCSLLSNPFLCISLRCYSNQDT